MGYSRSRAKCVPLHYPSTATPGVKEAHNKKSFLNQNLIVVSTPLQEQTNTSKTTSFNRESADHPLQTESGMFCELLNKKGMECEKYQDCSWFQQNSLKLDCNNKLSPAEIFDPFIDDNEFNMSLQSAEAHIPIWGDECLEVFTDDIFEENYNLKEKKHHISPSNENFYENYGEDHFDSCNINFSLKKSDSLDSMKNISLTNPSEVIPITYEERLNNPNYGQSKINRIKSEVKEEICSPVSNVYIIESDENELIIGREEEVEELNTAQDTQVVNKKKTVDLDLGKSEISFDDVPSAYAVSQNCEMKGNFENINNSKNSLPMRPEHDTTKEKIPGKFDMNLDITKLNFEPSINVNTPDLDFMDLVDFINEEMQQECNIGALNSSQTNIICQKDAQQEPTLTEDHSSVEKIQSPVSSTQASFVQDQPLLNKSELETSGKASPNRAELNYIAELDSGVSIAERIKTSAKRRTRKSLKDIIDSEDDEDSGSSDEDYKDDDYDYREDLVKQRTFPIRRSTKLSSVDSRGDCKRDEIDSYRERRDKNNEASRRSRQNRKARERHLYETLAEEERRNVKLKAEADVLEKQVTSLRQLLLQVVLHKGGGTT